MEYVESKVRHKLIYLQHGLTDMENRLWLPTIIYIGWINNKVILYSTGNYNQ